MSFGPLVARTGINASKSYTQWQDQQRQVRRREFNWTDTYQVWDAGWSGVGACDGSNPDVQCYDPYMIVMNCDTAGTIFECNRSLLNNGGLNNIVSSECQDYCSPRANVNRGPVQTQKGQHVDWVYRTSGNADTPGYSTLTSDAQNTANGSYTNTQAANCNAASCDASDEFRDFPNLASKNDNRDWGLASRTGPNWADSTARSIAVRNTLTSPARLDVIPTNPSSSITMSPQNNFGSAAIDGLLINHMKITTKGL